MLGNANYPPIRVMHMISRMRMRPPTRRRIQCNTARRKQCSIRDSCSLRTNKPKNKRPRKLKRSLLSLDRTTKFQGFPRRTRQKQKKAAHPNLQVRNQIMRSLKRCKNGQNLFKSIAEGLDSLLVLNTDNKYKRNRNFLVKKMNSHSRHPAAILDASDVDEIRNPRCYCKYCLNLSVTKPVHCRYYTGSSPKFCRDSSPNIAAQGCGMSNFDSCTSNGHEERNNVNTTGKPNRLSVEIHSSSYCPNWQFKDGNSGQSVNSPAQLKSNRGCDANDNGNIQNGRTVDNGNFTGNRQAYKNAENYPQKRRNYNNTAAKNYQNKEGENYQHSNQNQDPWNNNDNVKQNVNANQPNHNSECSTKVQYGINRQQLDVGNGNFCQSCLKKIQNLNISSEQYDEIDKCCSAHEKHRNNGPELNENREKSCKICSDKQQHGNTDTEQSKQDGNSDNRSTKQYGSDRYEEYEEKYYGGNDSKLSSIKQQNGNTKQHVEENHNKQDRSNISEQKEQGGFHIKCRCYPNNNRQMAGKKYERTGPEPIHKEQIGNTKKEHRDKYTHKEQLGNTKREQNEHGTNRIQGFNTKERGKNNQVQQSGKNINSSKVSPGKQNLKGGYLVQSRSNIEFGRGRRNPPVISSDNSQITSNSGKSQITKQQIRRPQKFPSCSNIARGLERKLETISSGDVSDNYHAVSDNSQITEERYYHEPDHLSNGNSRRNPNAGKIGKDLTTSVSDVTMSNLLTTLREKCRGTDVLTLKVVKIPRTEENAHNRGLPRLKLRVR